MKFYYFFKEFYIERNISNLIFLEIQFEKALI